MTIIFEGVGVDIDAVPDPLTAPMAAPMDTDPGPTPVITPVDEFTEAMEGSADDHTGDEQVAVDPSEKWDVQVTVPVFPTSMDALPTVMEVRVGAGGAAPNSTPPSDGGLGRRLP